MKKIKLRVLGLVALSFLALPFCAQAQGYEGVISAPRNGARAGDDGYSGVVTWDRPSGSSEQTTDIYSFVNQTDRDPATKRARIFEEAKQREEARQESIRNSNAQASQERAQGLTDSIDAKRAAVGIETFPADETSALEPTDAGGGELTPEAEVSNFQCGEDDCVLEPAAGGNSVIGDYLNAE